MTSPACRVSDLQVLRAFADPADDFADAKLMATTGQCQQVYRPQGAPGAEKATSSPGVSLRPGWLTPGGLAQPWLSHLAQPLPLPPTIVNAEQHRHNDRRQANNSSTTFMAVWPARCSPGDRTGSARAGALLLRLAAQRLLDFGQQVDAFRKQSADGFKSIGETLAGSGVSFKGDEDGMDRTCTRTNGCSKNLRQASPAYR